MQLNNKHKHKNKREREKQVSKNPQINQTLHIKIETPHPKTHADYDKHIRI